ncbi:DNA replication/checkpoint protein [Xylariales sp. AK1849]|nr:DNA replication/checkpoint protein [Xylariales sp. AK1849]
MEESEKQKYEVQSQVLRTALKEWEGDWAKKNGKKPGKQDIKENPIIAQKYKRYNQIRDILSGKIPPPSKPEPRPRKRKSDTAPSQSPSKRSRPAATPSKSQQYTDLLDGFETPSIRKLFSPAIPTSIGPTPQRDGRVLGLFDLLDEKRNDENTPSRPRHGDPSFSPDNTGIHIQATPSRRSFADMEHESGSVGKLGRTPVSASKRAMLDGFMTPLKNRDGNAYAGSKTPTQNTVSKLQFSTPEFLRRAPLPPMDGNGGYTSPQHIRLPRKPLARGLSSVVASLRKMEEEKLDDDLDALREMENNDDDADPSKPQPAKANNQKESSNILVPDSQAPNLLGGFDDEGLLDSEPEEQLGRDGQPLRVYKKKGQKRTTRKVNMRPTRSKRPQQPMAEPVSEDEGDGQGDDAVLVPETQFDSTKLHEDSEPLDLGSDYDLTASGGEDEERPRTKSKTDAAKKKKTKKAGMPDQMKDQKQKENPVKKAAKKVNELAHANFKRLKLRNNGAKGGAGFGSRFRRRR